MEFAQFFSKILGVYLIIVGLFYLLRPEQAKEALRDVIKSKGLRLVLAALGTLGGLAIVIGNPVWTFDVEGAITLLGALMVVRGITEMFYPKVLTKLTESILQKPRFTTISFFVLALGIFLSYLGWN